MNRRGFIATVGASLGVVRFGTVRCAGPVRRIGLLLPSTRKGYESRIEAFGRGLRERGYVDGGNLAIEHRFAELVASNPHVIVTQGPAALSVRRLTSTIPVVFGFSGDPVEAGMVQSLSRPGGNLTGISFLTL